MLVAVVSPHILSKSESNKNETVCKKCSEYETQWKEDLDELGSAQMIIKILQKGVGYIYDHK